MKPFLSLMLVLVTCLAKAPVLHAQHDGARDSVRHIANGKFGQVQSTLQKKKPFAGQAESAFVEMLSLLAQDEVAPALAKARQAVKLGLP
ncbi:MAG: hypothetical protein MI861_15875, partial [Pirellulales bacterium]|nr:hypothetical protein [Pirellulales bacterium]